MVSAHDHAGGDIAGDVPAGSIRVDLGATLDITRTESLYREFSDALSSAKTVVLDGREVAHADMASLQMLAGFFLAAANNGAGCRWDGISGVLRDAVRLCGLDPDLMSMGE
jgi:anti-anti-sigma regulatory factor